MGIAQDILTLFREWADRLASRGVSDHVVTPGDGLPHKLLENTNHTVLALTILNSGTGTLYIGYAGHATFPLVAGASLSFRGMNPVARKLTYIDTAGTPTVIDIMG